MPVGGTDSYMADATSWQIDESLSIASGKIFHEESVDDSRASL
jgi:hypothetical protein